jgi:hypothetical protein
MSSPEELILRFNEDEAIWRRYQEKRRERRYRFRLRSRLAERLLDQFDWVAAERETRSIRVIGKWIDR